MNLAYIGPAAGIRGAGVRRGQEGPGVPADVQIAGPGTGWALAIPITGYMGGWGEGTTRYTTLPVPHPVYPSRYPPTRTPSTACTRPPYTHFRADQGDPRVDNAQVG